MRVRRPRRRLTAVLSALALSTGTLFALIGGATPAGAATSTGTGGYDCYYSLAGQRIPLIVTATGLSMNDPAYPVGDPLGASTLLALNFNQGLIAGYAASGITTVTSFTLTNVDVNGTNTTPASQTIASATGGPGDVTAVTVSGTGTVVAASPTATLGGWTKGVDVPSFVGDSNFAVGASFAGKNPAAGGLLGVPDGAVIGLIEGSVAYLLDPTGPTPVDPSAAVGVADPAAASNQTLTIPASAPSALSFSSNGTSGATASLSLGNIANIDFGTNLAGFTSGVDPAAPGDPVCITPSSQLPPLGPTEFATSALENGTTTAASQSVNVGTDTPKAITLTGSDPDGDPAGDFTITAAPANGTLTGCAVDPCAVGGTVNGAGYSRSVTYTPGAGYIGSDSFQFTVTDAPTDPGVTPSTSAAATVSLQVGTPPVDQPLEITANAGQLVLTCTNVTTQPGNTQANADKTCDTITFSAVDLTGTTQTRSAAMNSIYVADGRGDVVPGWSLGAYMLDQVDLATGLPCAAPGDPTCANYFGFTNAAAGADLSLANNHIPAKYLSLDSVSCVAIDGNQLDGPGNAPVAQATAGAGGSFGVGGPSAPGNDAVPSQPVGSVQAGFAGIPLCSSGTGGTSLGLFQVDGTFNLTIPGYAAAGDYKAIVQYLVL